MKWKDKLIGKKLQNIKEYEIGKFSWRRNENEGNSVWENLREIKWMTKKHIWRKWVKIKKKETKQQKKSIKEQTKLNGRKILK